MDKLAGINWPFSGDEHQTKSRRDVLGTSTPCSHFPSLNFRDVATGISLSKQIHPEFISLSVAIWRQNAGCLGLGLAGNYMIYRQFVLMASLLQ
jgi:hypothetical protein